MEITISVKDLFLIIAGISVIIVTAVLVPLLVQLRKTGRQAEKLMDDIDREIEPLLSSLRITAAELQLLSENINCKLAEADTIIRTARYAGESLLVTSSMIKTVLTPFITRVGGLSAGIKAFMSLMHRSSTKKEREAASNE